MAENLSCIKCQCILIVEDEEDIRENLKMLLELEGYKVFTAINGDDGLKVLRTLKGPCLILLDLLMPVMNGMEFLKEKKHEDAIAQIPVCIVSGVAEKPDMNGVSAFVKKPIDLEILLKVVKIYCRPISL